MYFWLIAKGICEKISNNDISIYPFHFNKYFFFNTVYEEHAILTDLKIIV